jgi:lysyl-tRNA synthetase class 2
VFIIDYPQETSPLARRKDSDPSLVDRFELFVHGRELCNAFSELNDPADQEARFRHQVELKERGNAETMDYDADYIQALEHGMPPAAGFGMGVDRLVMALTNEPSIAVSSPSRCSGQRRDGPPALALARGPSRTIATHPDHRGRT